MNRTIWPLLVLLALLLQSSEARAEPPTDCSTPRNAADSVFGWLQPDSYDVAKAARCLDPQGRSQAELLELARQIKTVYDADALVVNMDSLSDSPDFSDEDTGRPVVAPHPKLPDVVIAKQPDGQWRWTEGSLNRVEARYANLSATLPPAFLERLPSWLRGKVFGVEFWQYLSILIILLIGLVMRKVIQVVVANRVSKLAEKIGQKWMLSLVHVFASPGATLLMAGLLRVAYPELRLPIGAALAMSIAVRMLLVVSVVWAAYRLVDVVADRLAEKAASTESKLDDQLVPLVRKTLKLITVVGGILFILQNLNVNVGSLLAGLGIGGVAVALAAKDTVANFFGSLMIFLDRPFQIGDWVQISGVEGIVEEVGFRSTRIRTFYNSVVTVPNARFTEANIDNFGRREYRRTFVTLNLTYDTTSEQMQSFVEGVRSIILANPHTRKDYYEVHMSGFGAHSLDVMLYFFFKVDSWSAELRERHNVFLEIMRLAQDLGVEFAFPTQTLHVDALVEPGKRRALASPKSNQELAGIVEAFGPDGERARPHGPVISAGHVAALAPAAQSTGEN